MATPTTLPPLVREQWVPMSYEEFLDWVPDGAHGEWVRGKGIVFMPPNEEHQDGVLLLGELLAHYARIFELGKVVISPFEMRVLEGASRREPDILFVAAEHADRLQGTRLDGAADLAIEFISDTSVTRDRGEKLAEYAAAGVPEYLIVDLVGGGRRLDLFRLGPGRRYQAVEPDELGRCHFRILPGLWIKPEWLWETPRPSALKLLRRISPEGWRRLVAAVEADS